MTALKRHPIENGGGRPKGYFLKDGAKVPSVTEILKSTGGSNPGLDYWHMKHGFECKRMGREARDVGSATHDAIETHIHGGSGEAFIEKQRLADGLKFQARCAFAGWQKWRSGDGARFRFLGTELPFVSEKYHFGGTIDALMLDTETGEFFIGEWKTSKRFYVDMPLQVAAYSLLLKECRDIEVSGAIVVRCDKVEGKAVGWDFGETMRIAEKEFVVRRRSHFYTKKIAKFYGLT